MSQGISVHSGRSTGARAPRVLVFEVDDGLFSLQVDRVEAVYPRDAVAVHSTRDVAGRPQPFVLHGEDPALVLDLRDAFGLQGARAAVARSHYLVMRSGSIPLALPVDGCVGVRELDFSKQTPVPASVIRDGGFPVGHLVTLDGRMLVVLDPNHLLEGTARDALLPVVGKARAFQQRQARIESLWARICAEPTAADVRTFGRLCGRNGRGKPAGAARLVWRHLSEPPAPAGGEPSPQERVVAELMQWMRERRTGLLVVAQDDGSESGRMAVVSGHVIDAQTAGLDGRAAFKRLLGGQSGVLRAEGLDGAAHAERILDNTVALTIWALESLGNESRTRRRRQA